MISSQILIASGKFLHGLLIMLDTTIRVREDAIWRYYVDVVVNFIAGL